MIRLKQSPTSLIVALSMTGLFVFASACTHQKLVTVGTHKVILSRHGFEKKLRVNAEAVVPTFEYEGVSATGDRMKVKIAGDKVTVNDVDYGKLRPGDSVLIGDKGVAVNDLDYPESEKYLRANGSASEATAQH
jgi:hypothetical protein